MDNQSVTDELQSEKVTYFYMCFTLRIDLEQLLILYRVQLVRTVVDAAVTDSLWAGLAFVRPHNLFTEDV